MRKSKSMGKRSSRIILLLLILSLMLGDDTLQSSSKKSSSKKSSSKKSSSKKSSSKKSSSKKSSSSSPSHSHKKSTTCKVDECAVCPNPKVLRCLTCNSGWYLRTFSGGDKTYNACWSTTKLILALLGMSLLSLLLCGTCALCYYLGTQALGRQAPPMPMQQFAPPPPQQSMPPPQLFQKGVPVIRSSNISPMRMVRPQPAGIISSLIPTTARAIISPQGSPRPAVYPSRIIG